MARWENTTLVMGTRDKEGRRWIVLLAGVPALLCAPFVLAQQETPVDYRDYAAADQCSRFKLSNDSRSNVRPENFREFRVFRGE